MVRLLKSSIHTLQDRDALEEFARAETVFALAHIPSSFCLAIGVLSETNVVSFASSYSWHLVLLASLYMLIAHCRDVNYSSRRFFISIGDLNEKEQRRSDLDKLHGTAGGQMQMLASMTMAVGSLSLVNSAILGLVQKSASPSETCARQFALGFSFLFLGSAGNNIGTESWLNQEHSTRLLLSFLHVVGSAALSVSALISLPSLLQKSPKAIHQTLVTALSSTGAFCVCLSAVMYYFHTLASCAVQRELSKQQTLEKAIVVSSKEGVAATPAEEAGYLRRLRNAIESKRKAFRWQRVPTPEAAGQRRVTFGQDIESVPADDSSYHYGSGEATDTSRESLSNSSSWSGGEEEQPGPRDQREDLERRERSSRSRR